MFNAPNKGQLYLYPQSFAISPPVHLLFGKWDKWDMRCCDALSERSHTLRGGHTPNSPHLLGYLNMCKRNPPNPGSVSEETHKHKQL